jgi:hypothetical protein
VEANSSFRRYLVFSQVTLYATVLLCVALAPSSLSANSGLSYFGVHKLTVIPFGLGLLVSAYFILKSTHFLPAATTGHKRLGLALRTISLLIVGIVVTPYSLGNWFDGVHRVFGITLFSVQLLLAIQITVFIKRDWPNWALLNLQLAGGLLSLIYLSPPQGFLIQGQLLFQLAFSIILLRNADAFSKRNK